MRITIIRTLAADQPHSCMECHERTYEMCILDVGPPDQLVTLTLCQLHAQYAAGQLMK